MWHFVAYVVVALAASIQIHQGFLTFSVVILYPYLHPSTATLLHHGRVTNNGEEQRGETREQWICKTMYLHLAWKRKRATVLVYTKTSGSTVFVWLFQVE